MTYDANNKLLKLGENDFVYDEDGNMIKGLVGDTSTSLKYDSQNRLIEIGDTKYTYDAEGTRTAKNNTKYTYNTVNTLSQLLVKQDGDKTTKYVYGAGVLISQHTKDEVRIFHYDLRGSTIALTDLKGKITDTYEYDAYGKVTAIEGTLESTDFLYNGRDGVMNEGNGLYYMRTRYYSPDLRRFINADILTGSIDDSDTMNQYAYVEGNPFSMIDPFGMCAEPGSGTKSKSFMQKLGGKVKNFGKGIANSIKNMTVKDWCHVALDVAGLIPVYGFIGDLANAALYAYEGDALNASLSLTAAIPGVGYAATGGKIANKGGKAMQFAMAGGVVIDAGADAARVSQGAVTAANAGIKGAKYAAKAGKAESQYYEKDGSPKWPPNRGFEGTPTDMTLQPGMKVDRYGYDGGTFVSPKGTSYTKRALPEGTNLKPYTVFEVVKPVKVKGGKVAPWFGEKGGGIQYEFNKSISELLEDGVLRKVG